MSVTPELRKFVTTAENYPEILTDGELIRILNVVYLQHGNGLGHQGGKCSYVDSPGSVGCPVGVLLPMRLRNHYDSGIVELVDQEPEIGNYLKNIDLIFLEDLQNFHDAVVASELPIIDFYKEIELLVNHYYCGKPLTSFVFQGSRT